MEYQKIINLLDNTPNWVGINNNARGRSNSNSQIKFKTSMFKSSLCGYSDAYILVNGTISITRVRANVTPMYNLREYSNNYSKTSGGLWQYYRDELALTDIANFSTTGNSKYFF